MAETDDFLTRIARSEARAQAPAIAAVFVKRGAEPRYAAFGRRSAFAREQATVRDLWHIGSCTKAMTATLLARLVERRTVGFDAPLVDVFPELAGKMHRRFRETPLRDVLTHSAGIARDPERSTFAALRRSGAGAEAQRRFLAVEALRVPPRPGTGYSNLGYILLGALVEARLGIPWEEALAQEVMALLGIGRFGFGPPGELGTLDEPRGHRYLGGVWRVRGVGPEGDNPIAYGPAGRVHIALEGWGQFLAMQLGEGPRKFLAPATLREMQVPAKSGFAMGWGVVRDAETGERRLRHTGSNTAWYALALLAPLRGCGVGIVCNGFNDAVVEAVEALGQAIMHFEEPDAGP